MNKKLIFFIVKQYLKFDKTNPFISVTALLAFFGVSIGVMVLILTMAIMNGTQKEFQDKLFTMNYPLSVYSEFDGSMDIAILHKLEKEFPDFQFSPYIFTQAIIQNGSMMSGGVIYGVDYEKEAKINKIFKSSGVGLNPNSFEVIVGDGIFNELGFQKNQKATIYFTNMDPAGLSTMPKLKRFGVKGSFKSGLNAYDKTYMYTSLGALQAMFGLDEQTINGIHISSPNPMEDIKKIQNALSGYHVGVVGWWEQNGNFFSAMELEKKALFVVLMLIILVASLNIISSLMMNVMSRRKEIALLLSLGASTQDVKNIFLFLGLIIGYSGLLFGLFLGFSGMFVLDRFDIISIPADVYGTSKLPINLDIVDFLSILFGSIVIIFISSYYPAKKATQIHVVDVLRNE